MVGGTLVTLEGKPQNSVEYVSDTKGSGFQ